MYGNDEILEITADSVVRPEDEEIMTITDGNVDSSAEPDILEITPECLTNYDREKILIDFESGASLLNPLFFSIAAACVAAFGYQVSQGLFDLTGPDPENFTFQFANWGDRGSVHGIFTAIFLHGSVDHLIGNLLFFYPMALIVHKLYGTAKGLGMFVALGAIAGTATYHLHGGPAIGASGAIFGTFGLVTMFYVRNRSRLSENLRDAAWVLPIVGAYQIFLGFTNPIVDNTAHVAGYLAGILFGLVLFSKEENIADVPSGDGG